MKKKVKIISIIVILIAVVIVTILLVTKLKPSDKKKENSNDITSAKKAEEYVEKLNDIIINGGTKKELSDATVNKKLLDIDIMTGKDSYLRKKPSKQIIEKYKLDNYVKISSKIASNLETKIKENFAYKIEGVAEGKDYYSVLVTYKTYYYSSYINTLNQIQNALLIKAGYNLEDNFEHNSKFKADLYRAKIKAGLFLDSYLDEYINMGETKTIYVTFDDKKVSSSSDSLNSYLINLTGYTYNKAPLLSNTQEKVTKCLSEINDKDPLKLS